MKKYLLSGLLLNLFLSFLFAQQDKGISPDENNPMYWQYNGKPIFLFGGSSNDNLFQNNNLIEELDLIESLGGNFVRGNMSWRDEGNDKPYLKQNGMYDLTKPNPVYWNKFEKFLQETEKRNIIIALEMWPTVDFYENFWTDNPFNPELNINYSSEETKIPGKFNYNHWEKLNPIFNVLPGLKNSNPKVFKYMQNFVSKVIALTLKHNNVLYCMNNENYANPKWGQYWINYVKNKAKKINKKIFASDMFDDWDPTGKQIVPMNYMTSYDHPNLGLSSSLLQIENPQIYDFIDISNSNSQFNEIHYAINYWVYKKVKQSNYPRPIMVDKVYGGPISSRWCGNQIQGAERFWRNLFAGLAASRFHRQPHGNGIGSYAQIHIKSMKMLLDKIDLFNMEPEPWFISFKAEHEIYTLARKDRKQFAVLFLDGGRPSLNLLGEVTFQWLDVTANSWREKKKVNLTKGYEINVPDSGFWVLLIEKQ
jgi:hypothetical protein